MVSASLIMTYVLCHVERGRVIPSPVAYGRRNCVICQGKFGLCRGAGVLVRARRWHVSKEKLMNYLM